MIHSGQWRRDLHRFRRLLRYGAPYRRGWAFIIGFTLLSTALGLLQPWPMKVLVDQVLGKQPMGGSLAWLRGWLLGAETAGGLLTWVVLVGLLIFAMSSAAEVVLTFAWVRAGQRMAYDLANDLFAHLQRRSLLFHSRNCVADSISRIIGDSWCVYTVVNALLLTPVIGLLTLGVTIAVMTRLNMELMLLSVAVAPFMVGSQMMVGRLIHAAAQAGRESESRIQAHVHQTLSGMPVVQAFVQEEREHQRFRELATAVISIQRRNAFVGSLSGFGPGLIATLGAGAVLWVGAYRVLDGRLTLGSMLLFVAYLGSLQVQITALAGIHSALKAAGASVNRVMEVLEAEPEVRDRPGAVVLPPGRGRVGLEGVTFGYEPGRPVLREVTLEALPGETVALVGATGVGKSTLVSLIPRFFDPWAGRVTVDGRDVRDVQLQSLRAQVALLLQEPFLFAMTVAENIAYGRPGASRAEVEAAARAANAHAFIEGLPDGYDTPVGERGATLSGGERQRVAIARALLKDAPVLILDEPTSALDAGTEALLLEALERLRRGRTTFVIAHRLSTVHGADRIVVLQDGGIAESGTHAELLRRGEVYARLHDLQSAPRLGERKHASGLADVSQV